jgi:hypothetical protein
MEDEKNLGGFEALLLDWQLYHQVLQMQRCLPSDRWYKVTHLSVDLVLSMENIFFDEEKHYLYHLVSRYCNLAFSRVNFEQEAQKVLFV